MALALGLAAAHSNSQEGHRERISVDLSKQNIKHNKRHAKNKNLTDSKFKDILGNVHLCKVAINYYFSSCHQREPHQFYASELYRALENGCLASFN